MVLMYAQISVDITSEEDDFLPEVRFAPKAYGCRGIEGDLG